jgi:hypothetical protein
MIKVERVPAAPITYDTKLTLKDKDLAVLATFVKVGLQEYRRQAQAYHRDRRDGPHAIHVLARQDMATWLDATDPTADSTLHSFQVGATPGWDDTTVRDIVNALRI